MVEEELRHIEEKRFGRNASLAFLVKLSHFTWLLSSLWRFFLVVFGWSSLLSLTSFMISPTLNNIYHSSPLHSQLTL